MDYVCDGPAGLTWFRLETESEAEAESELMGHAVAKHFRLAREAAARSFKPVSTVSFEEHIGRDAHIARVSPLFVTLRDREGLAHVTAKLPPEGRPQEGFRALVVGRKNGDPYPQFGAAIEALATHFGLTLAREDCYPYG